MVVVNQLGHSSPPDNLKAPVWLRGCRWRAGALLVLVSGALDVEVLAQELCSRQRREVDPAASSTCEPKGITCLWSQQQGKYAGNRAVVARSGYK